MALIQFRSVNLSYGGPLLLDGADLVLEPGERVGLVGRNGAGKSSLMKVIAGMIPVDSGEVQRKQGLRCTMLPQDVPDDLEGRVGDRLRAALTNSGGLQDWEMDARIDALLSRMMIDGDEESSVLSAGKKRRCLLAEAVVGEPDLLLLDEPTNHLDIRAIERLEEMLARFEGALLFVTHDRAFLKRVATRILDLDRGQIRSYDCNYELFLERKEAELEAEAERNLQFDKKLAKEEAWIRRGMKARRRRNMGRVAELMKMREQRASRREEVGRAKGSLQEAKASGRIVADVEALSFSYGEQKIVRDLSIRIMRGDRLGIVGPNGCGKTTLIRLLLGGLEPDAGTVQLGTKIDVAVFDQLHETLNLSQTPFENIGQGSDRIEMGGGTKHVMGYLQDFLFTPDQIRSPASKLSGGERNRLQLARILSRPTNLLILDEPTNDLDLETLDLLEELLADFDGTLLVVSHDREFLDNTVTSTLFFEGDGHWKEYDGGYEDLMRQRRVQEKAVAKAPAKSETKTQKPAAVAKPKKLSYKEKLELEKLPERIEELEAEKAGIFELMASPEFYKQSGDEVARKEKRLAELEDELLTSFSRWEELEARAD